MSIQTIKFEKRPWRDSKGRNGFILTSGVEITAQGACDGWDECDGAVMLQPITSRGEVSEACRVSVAMSALPALPALIAALATLLPEGPINDTVRGVTKAGEEASAYRSKMGCPDAV